MQLLHKKKKTGDGGVQFPELQCLNPVTMVATFVAEINGERIECRIKLSELNRMYPQKTEDPMHTVTLYKRVLQKIAKLKIEQNIFDENGSVTISYQDLKGA